MGRNGVHCFGSEVENDMDDVHSPSTSCWSAKVGDPGSPRTQTVLFDKFVTFTTAPRGRLPAWSSYRGNEYGSASMLTSMGGGFSSHAASPDKSAKGINSRSMALSENCDRRFNVRMLGTMHHEKVHHENAKGRKREKRSGKTLRRIHAAESNSPFVLSSFRVFVILFPRPHQFATTALHPAAIARFSPSRPASAPCRKCPCGTRRLPSGWL